MSLARRDSFGTHGVLDVDGSRYRIARLTGVAPEDLPYSVRIALGNLLRHEDGSTVTVAQIQALLDWGTPDSYATAVDLHAAWVDPVLPAELVIDHSVIARLGWSARSRSQDPLRGSAMS